MSSLSKTFAFPPRNVVFACKELKWFAGEKFLRECKTFVREQKALTVTYNFLLLVSLLSASAVAASSEQGQVPIIAVAVTVGIILIALVTGFLMSGR